VTWDTHGIQSEEFVEAAGPFQQQAKRDGVEGAVPVKKHVSEVLSNLSALPNLYPITSVSFQQNQQNQQPQLLQSRSNLPSAVVMMGKPRTITASSSNSSFLTPPTHLHGKIDCWWILRKRECYELNSLLHDCWRIYVFNDVRFLFFPVDVIGRKIKFEE
jgi:hypothetical protein